MDFAFVFLSTLYYYSIVSQYIDSVASIPEYFRIIEDQHRVYELARKYAKYKAPWMTIKNKLSIEKKDGGICDSNPQIKVAFCREFLRMSFFGYKFKDWDDNALICRPNTFWITKRNRYWKKNTIKMKDYTVEMYSCPDIFYRDLELDTDISVDTSKRYVSRGHERDSAIVFHQNLENNDDKIYPQKYFENIAFQRLIPQPRVDTSVLPEEYQPDVTWNPISIEEELIAYSQTIKLNKPYEKFLRTFHSINICGQRKPHKVFLCRESIRDVYGSKVDLGFDEDYDESKCRKRIKIRVNILNDDNFTAPQAIQNLRKSMKKSGSFYRVHEVSILFLHCPQMLVRNKNDFVYLASNLRQRSVIFYIQPNDPVDPFYITSIVNQLKTEKIDEDNRRTRLTLYPLERERQQQLSELERNYLQEFEEKINSMDSSVQTPMTIATVDADRLSEIADTPKSIQLIQKPRLVEDIVIKYAEIKTMKLPYTRFKMAYQSLDICELPMKLKKTLCEDIKSKYPLDVQHSDPEEVRRRTQSMASSTGQLGDSEIYYTPREQDPSEATRRCTRSEIHLRKREIEHLKAHSFVMWECPTDRSGFGHMPTYFIAKCYLRNTTLVFRFDNTSEDGVHRIYPDAVVTEIDRDNLALTVLVDYIFKSQMSFN